VAVFDAELDAALRGLGAERFTIAHRIKLQVFEPKTTA
jgi:hypothetical protein